MMTGKIIILNGTSSSGKTSITKDLFKLFPKDETCLLSYDTFIEDYFKLLANRFPIYSDIDYSKPHPGNKFILPSIKILFYHTVQTFSELGKTVIVDIVLSDKKQLLEISKILEDYYVLFVGVHCPVEELRRREIARGDRRKGTAEYQLGFVHQNAVYDLEVSSFDNSSNECSLYIKNYFDKEHPVKAFQTMIEQSKEF
jgi:chloramphenicol 3-O phosphotransferase